jgi:hypothetical protein
MHEKNMFDDIKRVTINVNQRRTHFGLLAPKTF